jgi:hypothetical protein
MVRKGKISPTVIGNITVAAVSEGKAGEEAENQDETKLNKQLGLESKRAQQEDEARRPTQTLSVHTGIALSSDDCILHMLKWQHFCDLQQSEQVLAEAAAYEPCDKSGGTAHENGQEGNLEPSANEVRNSGLLAESDCQVVIQILTHICWESRAVSEDVIRCITTELRFGSLMEIASLLRLVHHLLNAIDDTCREDRRRVIFHPDRGIMSAALTLSRRRGSLESISDDEKKVVEVLRLFTDALADDPLSKFALNHLETIQWAMSWLREFMVRIQTARQTIPTGKGRRGASKSELEGETLASMEAEQFAGLVLQTEQKLRLVYDALGRGDFVPHSTTGDVPRSP